MTSRFVHDPRKHPIMKNVSEGVSEQQPITVDADRQDHNNFLRITRHKLSLVLSTIRTYTTLCRRKAPDCSQLVFFRRQKLLLRLFFCSDVLIDTTREESLLNFRLWRCRWQR